MEETEVIPQVIPVRHPGRWLTSAVIVVLAAMVINSLLTNERFEWDVVGEYFLSSQILAGLARTIQLTVIGMTLGISIGVIVAVMRLSPNPILSGFSRFFIWLFLGVPLLVQLLFWFNVSALYPTVSLGIPFGPEFVSGSANLFITTFTAAILGLALHEAAYMAEIVRSGILSVDSGQTQASAALGMTRGQMMRRIILPQAIRVIIPPTGGRTINLVKMSSLVSVLSLPELLYSTQIIYARTYQTIPLLIVACLWYLIVVTVLTVGQHYLERHYQRKGFDVLRPAV
ncbi:MAG: ABC transporter permease subunit [Acidimicrobiia bacterium]|nr:ABC transporter permease subunit [Acidimicrobiia bacterium]